MTIEIPKPEFNSRTRFHHAPRLKAWQQFAQLDLLTVKSFIPSASTLQIIRTVFLHCHSGCAVKSNTTMLSFCSVCVARVGRLQSVKHHLPPSPLSQNYFTYTISSASWLGVEWMNDKKEEKSPVRLHVQVFSVLTRSVKCSVLPLPCAYLRVRSHCLVMRPSYQPRQQIIRVEGCDASIYASTLCKATINA